MVIDRLQLARLGILIGQVNPLEGQLDPPGQRDLDRGVKVEGLVRALHARPTLVPGTVVRLRLR